MQINTSPSIPLIQRSPDSERAAPRPPRQGNENQRENNDTAKQAQQSQGATLSGTLLSPTQRVSASERSEQSNFRNVNPFSDVLPENRRALESYIDTANTPAETSAAELVGVDIFV